MGYQVIARKWRPQTFADVVGQAHITQTLGNALKNGRIHHGLLFTGPRGTGKTSSARILAKALRCPNAVNFVPCNECSSCEDIASGRSLDVQELDAASNNSVDDIRRLLDGVMNAPSSGQWKIYIIDEVHMLSSSAFNALLKTLEEPPAHVLFIMATTEIHKIPETILSRCQRFDFKRISTRQIAEQLRMICDNDGVKADEEALWLIARQGDGSMRDALSLLDQIITFAAGELKKGTVTSILGLTDRGLLFDTLASLMTRDGQGMLKVLEKFSQTGIEPRLFASELLESLRALLIVKISGAAMTSILDLPDSEMKYFAELGAAMSEEEIHLLFDMTLKGASDIARAQDARLVMEMMLLRMAAAPRIVDLQALLAQGPAQPRGELRPSALAAAEPVARKAPVRPSIEIKVGPMAKGEGIARTADSQNPTTSARTTTSSSAQNQAPAAKPEPAAPPKARSVAEGKTPQDRWLIFVELLRDQDAFFAAKVENLIFSGEDGKMIKLAVPPKLAFLKEQMADSEIRRKLKGCIDSLWGQGYSFEIVSGRETPAGDTAQSLANKKRDAHEDELRLKIAEHPMVKAAQAALKSEIKSVTTVKGAPK